MIECPSRPESERVSRDQSPSGRSSIGADCGESLVVARDTGRGRTDNGLLEIVSTTD